MYPENYTAFTAKRNAAYAGDPTGDYVLAEDINGVQAAVSALEQAVGIYHPSSLNLAERIQHLERANTARVPEVSFLTDSGFNGTLARSVEALSGSALVSLGTTDAYTAELIAGLTAKAQAYSASSTARKQPRASKPPSRSGRRSASPASI